MVYDGKGGFLRKKEDFFILSLFEFILMLVCRISVKKSSIIRLLKINGLKLENETRKVKTFKFTMTLSREN